MNRAALSLVVFTTLLFAGCHLVFPFSTGSPAKRDGAVLDGPWDAVSSGDAPLVRVEAAALDAPVVADQGADGWCQVVRLASVVRFGGASAQMADLKKVAFWLGYMVHTNSPFCEKAPALVGDTQGYDDGENGTFDFDVNSDPHLDSFSNCVTNGKDETLSFGVRFLSTVFNLSGGSPESTWLQLSPGPDIGPDFEVTRVRLIFKEALSSIFDATKNNQTVTYHIEWELWGHSQGC